MTAADSNEVEPTRTTVTVDGADVSVLTWPADDAAPVVVGVHGITANAWSWGPVARRLAGRVRLVCPDLRGRGASSAAPGPYGIRRHADDVAAVIEATGGGPAVVAGHSMGTYVALLAAERHPALVRDLVLVDGGTPIGLPDGVDPQVALEAGLGPVIERLRVVWPDRDAYRAMWAAHPSFTAGLSPDVERAVMSDLVETDGGFRSCVRDDVIRHDGGELFSDAEVRTALDRRDAPVRIIRAELNLLATTPPLIPIDVADRYPRHDWTTVAGSNHYDVFMADPGATIVAEAILAAAVLDA